YGGDGNDFIDGGYGNDELNGGNGNDTINGGFGADTVIGNDGNDVLSGGAGSDLMFGNAGNDFLNGGFGSDRMNGGTGADTFYHLGVADHGSDWVQDYSAAEGDLLAFGLAGATRAQFQVNFANTPSAGSADVAEAFIIYRPTGQIIWALVDGAGQDQINITLGGEVFNLLG
ncbi:MAG: calcium-binding protein, partial [Gemmobacter sp.]